MFSQGTPETTGNPLDMAIDGDGFFMVQEPGGANFYTRAGQFGVNNDGYIVNPGGNFLQGYQTDAAGTISGNIANINVSTVNSPPNATTSASFQNNLDARAAINTTWPAAPAVISPLTGAASGTYTFPSSITVFDSLGNSHMVNLYYAKTAANTWQVHATYNASATAVPNYREVGAPLATLTFTASGALDPLVGVNGGPIVPVTGAFDFSAWGATPAPGQSIAFNFGNAGNNTTQYGADSSMLSSDQNGYASGSLRALSVSGDGVIEGIFTNGQVRNIAQVALARFTAPTELTKMGNNLFAESSASGQPLIGSASTSGRGSINASSLEAGNVDLAEEFVRLIAAQRGFEANTKIITTTDELLQTLMAAKR
jgi:flagellar hook protein FlgE